MDYLGRVVYAKALAQQIERIKTPVTIGVFARWGTGKSFLLKQVKSTVCLFLYLKNILQGTSVVL